MSPETKREAGAASERSDFLAYGLLILTTLFWGGNAMASRLAVGEISPMLLTTLRWALCVIVILPFTWRALLANGAEIAARWRSIALMSLTGFLAFNALFYIAGHYTAGLNLVIIQGAIPVFVILGSRIVYRTPIRLIQVVGMVTTFLGVAAVASRGDLAVLAGLEFNLGDLLMIGACALYAAYTLSLRRKPDVPIQALFAAMSIWAMIGSLPLLFLEYSLVGMIEPGLFGWMLVLFVAIFPSILSQSFFMGGVSIIGPARAGLFVNLVPVFGSIMAVFVLGEDFGPHHALGLALVLSGIFMAEAQAIRTVIRNR